MLLLLLCCFYASGMCILVYIVSYPHDTHWGLFGSEWCQPCSSAHCGVYSGTRVWSAHFCFHSCWVVIFLSWLNNDDLLGSSLFLLPLTHRHTHETKSFLTWLYELFWLHACMLLHASASNSLIPYYFSPSFTPSCPLCVCVCVRSTFKIVPSDYYQRKMEERRYAKLCSFFFVPLVFQRIRYTFIRASFSPEFFVPLILSFFHHIHAILITVLRFRVCCKCNVASTLTSASYYFVHFFCTCNLVLCIDAILLFCSVFFFRAILAAPAVEYLCKRYVSPLCSSCWRVCVCALLAHASPQRVITYFSPFPIMHAIQLACVISVSGVAPSWVL